MRLWTRLVRHFQNHYRNFGKTELSFKSLFRVYNNTYMNEIEELEKRFRELASKPKTIEEVAETNRIGEKLSFLRSIETSEMLFELEQAGVKVNTIWDLVNTRVSYPTAIGILINHLSKNYHIKNKEAIFRSLAVKEAIGKASSALIAEYLKTPKKEENLRWVIGNSIFVTITKDDVDSILPIVQDRTNGMSRGRFVCALGKVKSEKVEGVLINLLDDDEVAPQALDALGRLKSQRAKEKIRSLLDHPQPLIRTEAKKALKKIK